MVQRRRQDVRDQNDEFSPFAGRSCGSSKAICFQNIISQCICKFVQHFHHVLIIFTSHSLLEPIEDESHNIAEPLRLDIHVANIMCNYRDHDTFECIYFIFGSTHHLFLVDQVLYIPQAPSLRKAHMS